MEELKVDLQRKIIDRIVSDLYKELGFSLIEKDGENSTWLLNVNQYNVKNKFIRINND